jgi:hypothetical protein
MPKKGVGYYRERGMFRGTCSGVGRRVFKDRGVVSRNGFFVAEVEVVCLVECFLKVDVDALRAAFDSVTGADAETSLAESDADADVEIVVELTLLLIGIAIYVDFQRT